MPTLYAGLTRRSGGCDKAILGARTEPSSVEAGYQGIQVCRRVGSGTDWEQKRKASHHSVVL